MALKRSRSRIDDAQLDLFAYAGNDTDHANPVRDDGRETLARVFSENGERIGTLRPTSGDAIRSGGQNSKGGLDVAPAVNEATGINGATGARPVEEEILLLPPQIPKIGHQRERVDPPRSQANHRITEANAVGKGSLKLIFAMLAKRRQNDSLVAYNRRLSLQGIYQAAFGIGQLHRASCFQGSFPVALHEGGGFQRRAAEFTDIADEVQRLPSG